VTPKLILDEVGIVDVVDEPMGTRLVFLCCGRRAARHPQNGKTTLAHRSLHVCQHDDTANTDPARTQAIQEKPRQT
jgi:hypothetical protein